MRRDANNRFAYAKPYSPKKLLLALLLCFVLGAAGVHRLYVGKNKTGILWLVTGGLLGVGVLVDYVRIAAGRFTDRDGLRLKL
jgi:TM2 domain-containing membrane protein YozV